MTLEEVSEKTGLSMSNIKKNFKRCQDQLSKKGFTLTKSGRGENTEYELEEMRARYIFDEEIKNQVPMASEQLKWATWEFVTFVGICGATALCVWRGYYSDFLRYLGIMPTEANIECLKNALKELQDKDKIQVTIDKTDENVFVAFVTRQVEKEYDVTIGRIKKCRELQLKYNSRSWVPFLKTWLAVENTKGSIYTAQDLSDLTGLSKNMIYTCSKRLKEEGLIMEELKYLTDGEGGVVCLGKVGSSDIVELGAIGIDVLKKDKGE